MTARNSTVHARMLGVSVCVWHKMVVVPVMVHVMVQPRDDGIVVWSATCVLGSRLEHARAQCRDV